MALQSSIKQAVGWLFSFLHGMDKRAPWIQDGPIESTEDTSVAEAGSSDYLNIVVHDQAKIIQLLKEAIQVLRHRAALLQQNHAINRISENMKEAGSSDYLVNIVHDEAIIIQLLEKIRMLHQATLIKNDTSDNLIDNHLGKTQEMIKIADSPDTQTSVQQGLQIQHLEEKAGKLFEKIARMDQILKPIDADHQETLKMLGVAKNFFNSFKPNRSAADAAITFFSENDEDIVQKINYMKEFFSYYGPPNRVKGRI